MKRSRQQNDNTLIMRTSLDIAQGEKTFAIPNQAGEIILQYFFSQEMIHEDSGCGPNAYPAGDYYFVVHSAHFVDWSTDEEYALEITEGFQNAIFEALDNLGLLEA